jgi:alkyl sulfatase BDS1-like metallo-beta-lactamase superfamily hydrolase
MSAPLNPSSSSSPSAPDNSPKPASEHTVRVHSDSLGSVGQLHPVDFERARRGLVAEHPTGVIAGLRGNSWDVSRYDFVNGDAPLTVHPSLWRQAQLNNIHGLFEVAPGVWQARGYDISNVTFIAGDEGWVVIDPLTTEATARACLELANAQLGERPVTAVIYTHSHTDHFGGVLGVTTHDDVAAGRCRVIAPVGFMLATVSENAIGGPAMNRRSAYQFGFTLPASPQGHVDCGLGKAIPVGSQTGLIAPTEDITHTGQELVVDGIRIVFQLTPETEAPAEMNFYFPDHRWLCLAENCSQNMHNLVPIRGAQVRDALAWSKYIGEAMAMFGGKTDVLFNSHHWPVWGTSDIHAYLVLQRDMYRWMHDQTMRFANRGLTPLEIAEELTLPPEFAAQGHTRGYYGSLIHNIKAVYQRYLSWYDGNPARLHPHPPTEAGKRYVDFMGGADALLAKAQVSFNAGDYRWVAEVVNHLVFADPANAAARALQADALEQLGYQCESATFRNAYLTGAQELRKGTPPGAEMRGQALAAALSIELMFDVLAVRLKADEVGGVTVSTNWHFTDVDEHWVLGLSNRALHATPNHVEDAADASVVTTKATLQSVFGGRTTIPEAIEAGTIAITGNAASLLSIFGHLEVFNTGFAIVEP